MKIDESAIKEHLEQSDPIMKMIVETVSFPKIRSTGYFFHDLIYKTALKRNIK